MSLSPGYVHKRGIDDDRVCAFLVLLDITELTPLGSSSINFHKQWIQALIFSLHGQHFMLLEFTIFKKSDDCKISIYKTIYNYCY